MYAPDITARAIDAASATQGWPLVPHTPDQVAEAIGHFADLWDDDHKTFRRALTPDERRFITNERKLAALDFRYWCCRYARIIDWRRESILFTPNVAQSIVLDIWGDMEREALAVLMLQLKARQLGVSTLTELAVCHRFQFHPRTAAVVASSDPDKSVVMAGMMRYCLEQQPWWLKPVTTKTKNAMPVEFGEINCTLAVEAGNQFSGVARGTTPNVFHLSEVSTWVDPEHLIDAALLKAVHPTPDVFGVLESTAFGRDNYYHLKWEQAKVDWPRRQSLFCPLFLPWYVGYDIYPTEAMLRAMPIPTDWQPSDRTVNHAERARQYVKSNPLLRKHLAKGRWDWTLPRAQLWYYETERDRYLRERQLNIFLSEMPSDDQEAFQSTNISVIDQDVLLDYRERTREPLGVYTIIGEGIPNELVVPRRQWDTTKPPITIQTGEVLSRFNAKYQLIPLIFEGYSGTDPTLKLFIWEFPTPQDIYGVGVDTADGIGLDSTVIEVLRKASPDRPDAQVAEFASAYIKAQQLWPMVLAVSTLYSTYSERAQRRTQCRVAIECMQTGEMVQDELQKRGWSNFHLHKLLGKRRPTPDSRINRVGVYTNVWVRADIIDMMLTCIDEEALDVPSPYLVKEMEALERDPAQQKIKAAYGAHDDRFMALGFPLFSLHLGDPPLRQYRQKVQYLPDPSAEPAPIYPQWAPPPYAVASTAPGVSRVLAFPERSAQHPIAAARHRGALAAAVITERLARPPAPRFARRR
jgi:hypothetical protein